jgi:hypothetical protein
MEKQLVVCSTRTACFTNTDRSFVWVTFEYIPNVSLELRHTASAGLEKMKINESY